MIPTMSPSSSVTPTLIPGLPEDIAGSIISSLPISHHHRLKLTCRSWHAFLSSPSALSLRRHRRRHILCIFPCDPSLSPPYLFDPSTLAWASLPPIPCSPHLYGLSNFAAVAVGTRVYVLGGSHFDARSYPLGRPTASGAVYRIDLAVASPSELAWERMPDMVAARGSFACAVVETNGRSRMGGGRWMEGNSRIPSSSHDGDGMIVIAGGGSRHKMFPCVGSRSRVAESFNVGTTEWRKMEPLPRCRAGCVGWVMAGEEEEEFWVMGGYGGYRTVSGVFPADIYCRDGAAFGLRSGKWREIGDMWDDGERRKLGLVAVLHEDGGKASEIFMLDENDIFRYNIASNRWMSETTLPRKIVGDQSCGFVAMDGELHVFMCTYYATNLADSHAVNGRKPSKKKQALDVQVYLPNKRKWRLLTATVPINQPLDFKSAILCTVHI